MANPVNISAEKSYEDKHSPDALTAFSSFEIGTFLCVLCVCFC